MTKTLLHEASSTEAPQRSQDNEAATSDHAPIDRKMEVRMRLKMDIFLIPLVSLIYLLSFIDRSNIGNAKIAGLEKDLGMHHYDFNIALSIFYISYIVFEIPSNLLCKWMGPGWFIPTTITGFGVLTVCTGLVQSFSSLCGIRFLLGIFEAGMMPSLVYFLARWYTNHELTFRVSLFIISASLAGAFGGLLASAILKLSHFGSLHSWRMIFGIEGLVTVILGLISFAILPDRPETAIWLTPEEKQLAVSRLRAERLSKSHKTEEFNWNKVRLGIFNPVVLPTSAIFLLNSTTVHGVSFFLPTIVKTIFPHEHVRTQQLLTVPPYVLGALACALTSLWSWKIGKREIFMIFCAPLTVIGYLLFLATDNFKVRYGAVFLPFFGIFTYGALTNSHVAANVVSDTSRTAAIATNVMFGNIGGLASTWAYVDKDAPHFKIGNGLNLACQASMIIIATGLYFWRKRDNKRRDEFQRSEASESATEADIDELDWKHPDFRWRE